MADFTRKYDEDLTIRKSDRYLPNVPKEVLESAKAKILKAIDNFHCTLLQIKRQAGFEASDDLSDIFKILEAEGVIVRQFNGTLTAFFRPEKVPTKFWHIGNDRLGVDYTPLPEPDKSKVGHVVQVREVARQVPLLNLQKSKLDTWAPDYIKELAQLGLSREETARKAGVSLSHLVQNLNHPSLKNAWDEGRRNYGLGIVQPVEIVEEMPAEISLEPPVSKELLEAPEASDNTHKNNGFAYQLEKAAQYSRTQEETASKLKMTVRGLNQRMKRHPEFREAYNRGRAKHKNYLETKNNENKENSMQTQTVMGKNGPTHSRVFIEVSEADVEKFASEAEGRILKDIESSVAAKLGISWSTLKRKLNRFPKLQQAYDRGRKIYHANQSGKSPKPEVEKKPIGKTNEVRVLDAIKNSNCHTVTAISDFTGLDRHYVIPALQNLMCENLVVKDIPEAGGDPVYSFIKAEAPKAEIKPTEVSNPEDIKIGIDSGRSESFTETFEAQMLPCEVEFHRELDELIKTTEPAYQDEKEIGVDPGKPDGDISVTEEVKQEDPCNWKLTEESPASMDFNNAIPSPCGWTPEKQPVSQDEKVFKLKTEFSGEFIPELDEKSKEAAINIVNNHFLLEKIKPENPINTIAAKKSIETPYFSGGILGKQASYSSETIDFGEAGDIILSADLNIFKLDQESREFVMGLVTSVQKFNAKRAER